MIFYTNQEKSVLREGFKGMFWGMLTRPYLDKIKELEERILNGLMSDEDRNKLLDEYRGYKALVDIPNTLDERESETKPLMEMVYQKEI